MRSMQYKFRNIKTVKYVKPEKRKRIIETPSVISLLFKNSYEYISYSFKQL